MPLVSVIIPVYNSAVTLERCLRSVGMQRTTAELDIILVDDGSTDESIRIAQSMKISLNIIRQRNLGAAAARNKGIDASRGEYITFLDSDDFWHEQFLNTTLEFLCNHPDTIAVSVAQRHHILGKRDSIVPNALMEDNSLHSQVLSDFWAFWARYDHICTGSVLMRSNVVRATGGQLPDLRICEDLEFWAYLATFGKWGFIPEVLFTSDGGAVTRLHGWLAKNRRRWASAPTVPEWERRILPRIPLAAMPSYSACRGRIAKNLVYCMVQSGRDAIAYTTTADYSGSFPADRVSRLLRRMYACGWIVWKPMCVLLRLRELARAIAIQIKHAAFRP